MGKQYFFQSKPDRTKDREEATMHWQQEVTRKLEELEAISPEAVPTLDDNIKLSPMRNQVYIKPYAAAQKVGRFYTPTTVQRRPAKALVMAVGRGTKAHPMTLQRGDTVFHIQGAGIRFENEQGEDIWLIQSTDCLAHIPKAAAPYVAAPLRVFEADLDSAEGLRRVAAGETHPYLPTKNIKQTD